MDSQLKKRVLREIKEAQKENDSSIRLIVDDADITKLKGTIVGPVETPYVDAEYTISIHLPPNYPFSPPEMKFLTQVWHPNVSSQTGVICLDVLKDKWLPILSIVPTLRMIQSLLASPQPDDPIDAEVAGMLRRSRADFWAKARSWAVGKAGAPALTAEAEQRIKNKWLERMDFLLPGEEGGGDGSGAGSGPGSASTGSAAASSGAGKRERAAAYGGYNPVFVDRMVGMGFMLDTVVGVLRGHMIPPAVTYGLDILTGEGLASDVTEWILTERTA